MKRYALGTFSAGDGARFVGLVMNDRVASLGGLAAAHRESELLQATTVLALLENWSTNEPALARLADKVAENDGQWHALAELHTHPAIDLPRQIFCTGANYRKHVVDLTVDAKVGPEGLDEAALRRWAEAMMDERLASGEPYAFTKPVSAVSGAFDPLVLPGTTNKPDWELELAVVIGRGGYQIPRERALDHVAGYAIVNDISARDLIPRTDYKMLGTDWLRSKGQPGFLPLGPYLVPKAFVPDPHRLKMRLTVSGQVMQDETTADMLFGIERQIEYISRYSRLLPGDVICTGSPAGNGTHYNRFLCDGDVMEAEIEGLGRQRQICIAQQRG
ncbi:fumarylacetoacetate hydrolase family protein [Paraburkholderia aspalathi]|uniref:2-keto-4-pentenoate hydratase/2-oxohepta-3-ene-1,7-dioic acid hydratase (Catechol pathway) n=1 Tax=Paraburkholderia aspalathi TaxID=1324617 RepID=A0A1I7BFL9_9BURK|nr:fumarylacetoacetate hydrolase family protein [Paraburkholderia aspalathi]SFT85967.1 2-keto-4-pentenoate hydratase/2-oxohepta-3-ene-1,7-dioic acid hydratase (catechol pathway) [Paraburkholderia aspalathi]